MRAVIGELVEVVESPDVVCYGEVHPGFVGMIWGKRNSRGEIPVLFQYDHETGYRWCIDYMRPNEIQEFNS